MLTGENGAAKTTLLRNILGLLNPTTGMLPEQRLTIKGINYLFGYVPQQVALFNTGFPSTVLELVVTGRYPKDCLVQAID